MHSRQCVRTCFVDRECRVVATDVRKEASGMRGADNGVRIRNATCGQRGVQPGSGSGVWDGDALCGSGINIRNEDSK